METPEFNYMLAYKGKDDRIPIAPDEKPANVMVGMPLGREVTVRWYPETQKWTLDYFTLPAMIDHPWSFRTQFVDRATAEAAALGFTTVPLPSEDEVRTMIETAPEDPFARKYGD